MLAEKWMRSRILGVDLNAPQHSAHSSCTIFIFHSSFVLSAHDFGSSKRYRKLRQSTLWLNSEDSSVQKLRCRLRWSSLQRSHHILSLIFNTLTQWLNVGHCNEDNRAPFGWKKPKWNRYRASQLVLSPYTVLTTKFSALRVQLIEANRIYVHSIWFKHVGYLTTQFQYA